MAKKTRFDHRFPSKWRESKYRYHRRQAKFWLFPLLLTSGLFYATGLSISGLVWPQLGCEIFILLILFWRITKRIRRIRLRHIVLADGYAKPFAEDVVSEAKRTNREFALFLRGFSSEAKSMAPSDASPEFGLGARQLVARPVEALLVEMLNEDVPLVALTDPGNPHPLGGAFRFQSVPMDWQRFVRELLPSACPIVMHLNSSFSVGLLDELELLKHPDSAKKTVIVVGKTVAIENSDAGQWERRKLTEFDHVVFQQIDSGWSRRKEIDFHYRLRACLRKLEHGTREIVRRDRDRFTVSTRSRGMKVLSFMGGPALGSIIGLFYFGPFFQSSTSILELIGMILFIWIILVVALSALKGLLFLFRIIS